MWMDPSNFDARMRRRWLRALARPLTGASRFDGPKIRGGQSTPQLSGAAGNEPFHSGISETFESDWWHQLRVKSKLRSAHSISLILLMIRFLVCGNCAGWNLLKFIPKCFKQSDHTNKSPWLVGPFPLQNDAGVRPRWLGARGRSTYEPKHFQSTNDLQLLDQSFA